MLSSFSPSRIVAALVTLSSVTSLHADQWTYSGETPSETGSQEILSHYDFKEIQYADSSTTVAKLQDDTLLAWGQNSYGVLNIPTSLINVSSYSVSQYLGVALLDNGNLTYWGNSGNSVTQPSNLPTINSVKVISKNTIAVTDTGLVLEWNESGVINANTPTFTKPVTSVSGYGSSRYAIHNDFTVSSWNSNDGTALSDTPTLSNIKSIYNTSDVSFALTKSGDVISWGDSTSEIFTVPADLPFTTNISAS